MIKEEYWNYVPNIFLLLHKILNWIRFYNTQYVYILSPWDTTVMNPSHHNHKAWLTQFYKLFLQLLSESLLSLSKQHRCKVIQWFTMGAVLLKTINKCSFWQNHFKTWSLDQGMLKMAINVIWLLSSSAVTWLWGTIGTLNSHHKNL